VITDSKWTAAAIVLVKLPKSWGGQLDQLTCQLCQYLLSNSVLEFFEGWGMGSLVAEHLFGMLQIPGFHPQHTHTQQIFVFV
jgi:hypothetical protein